jgi:hypothetical protein
MPLRSSQEINKTKSGLLYIRYPEFGSHLVARSGVQLDYPSCAFAISHSNCNM